MRTARNAPHRGWRCNCHDTPEWSQRNNHARSVLCGFLLEIQPQDPIFSLGKVFGQQPAVQADTQDDVAGPLSLGAQLGDYPLGIDQGLRASERHKADTRLTRIVPTASDHRLLHQQ